MTDSLSVVVIGGGITGLTAAHRLASLLGPDRVRLLERGGRVGGKIVTDRAGGFLIEGGPDCFIRMKPAGVDLCRDLGIAAELIGTRPERRGTFVQRSGRLHRLPGGGLVPSRILPLARTPLLSLKGKVRAGLEWFVPRRRRDDDESVETFARRRFGWEAYQWLLEPLLCGIHAGDGERLSLSATFPQLVEMEDRYGGILRATRRRRDGAGALFTTPTGGMGEIVSALAQSIPSSVVRTETEVTAIERGNGRYRVAAGGEVYEADAVVLATPAFASGRLLARLDDDLARALDEIPFVSTSTVSLAYGPGAVSHPLDGYGYVVPRAAGGPIVACTWASSKFAGRAPDGAVLLRLFIGRAGEDEIVSADDETLLTAARDEVRRTLGITAAPRLTRVFRWPRALPQYTVGHAARVEAIERLTARHEGLVLAGASYRGVGVPDCIADAHRAAAAAAAYADAVR